MVYPSLIACYNAPQKQFPVQLHELQIFTWYLTLTVLHFLVKHSLDPPCTDCHQQMFTQDHLNGTSAYDHSVGSQLQTYSVILHCHIFNSRTASDGCPDWGSASRLLLPWWNLAA